MGLNDNEKNYNFTIKRMTEKSLRYFFHISFLHTQNNDLVFCGKGVKGLAPVGCRAKPCLTGFVRTRSKSMFLKKHLKA